MGRRWLALPPAVAAVWHRKRRWWRCACWISKGEGTSEQILAGLEAVLASVRQGNPYHIRVVNLSLGGYDPEQWPPGEGTCDQVDPVFLHFFQQLQDEGVLAVAAAGNGGCRQGVAWPACLSPVVAVGAVYDDELCFDPVPLPFGCLNTTASFGEGQCMTGGCSDETEKNRIACYSDLGEKLGVWAPSHCARAPKKGGGYEDCFGGTSAAAPYVVGAAALLWQAFPYLTPVALAEALETTGTPRRDERNGLTRNRVDLAAAYDFLASTCSPPPPPLSVSFLPPSLCGQRGARSAGTEPAATCATVCRCPFPRISSRCGRRSPASGSSRCACFPAAGNAYTCAFGRKKRVGLARPG